MKYPSKGKMKQIPLSRVKKLMKQRDDKQGVANIVWKEDPEGNTDYCLFDPQLVDDDEFEDYMYDQEVDDHKQEVYNANYFFYYGLCCYRTFCH